MADNRPVEQSTLSRGIFQITEDLYLWKKECGYERKYDKGHVKIMTSEGKYPYRFRSG